MASKREAAEERRGGLVDPERVMQAAYELLLTVGPSRLTIANVARLSGVSRASVYRRWPNSEALVADVVGREWIRMGSEVVPDPKANLRDQLIDTVVMIVQEMGTDALWERILELEPMFLVRYLLGPRGQSTELQLQMLHFHLRRGMIEGSIRDGDPETMAPTLLAIAASFVLGPAVADETSVSYDGELKEVLRRYLAP